MQYVFGSAENAPIQLVAIARNKETGSSATLFVLDENGVGQVVLASGYSGGELLEQAHNKSTKANSNINNLFFIVLYILLLACIPSFPLELLWLSS